MLCNVESQIFLLIGVNCEARISCRAEEGGGAVPEGVCPVCRRRRGYAVCHCGVAGTDASAFTLGPRPPKFLWGSGGRARQGAQRQARTQAHRAVPFQAGHHQGFLRRSAAPFGQQGWDIADLPRCGLQRHLQKWWVFFFSEPDMLFDCTVLYVGEIV